MKNSIKNTFINKPGISVFLIAIFIGIFFLSYYAYYTISISLFKKEYQNHFLKIKEEIINEVNNTLAKQEAVNINKIVDPYLNQQVDLLVVYRTNQEIIQIFTKKGITKENLRKIDKLYSLNRDKASKLFFYQDDSIVSPTASNQTIENNSQNLNTLVLSAIAPISSKLPYRYLLVFNHDDYLKQKILLKEIINRNSFLGGLILLGLVALFFMVNEIKNRGQLAQKQKNSKKELPSPKNTNVTKITDNPSSLPSESPEDSDTVDQNKNNDKKISIQDSIKHGQDDVFFKEEDLIEENWATSNSDSNSDNKTAETNQEKKEPVSQTKDSSKKELVMKLFSCINSPLEESVYEEISNDEQESLSSKNAVTKTPQKESIRSFQEILTLKENLEQKRALNSQVKDILGIWLFAKPEKIFKKELKTSQLIDQLIRRCLETIHTPPNSEIDTYNSNLLLSDYKNPSSILYFRPETNSYEFAHKPILTYVYPKYLSPSEVPPSAVPWLGKEKKLFKKGLPYIEKKSQAIAIATSRIINDTPHILKILYFPKDYEQLLYEQKIQLLYIINVFWDCLEDSSKLYQNLFNPSLDLEEKAQSFFDFIFRRDPSVIRLLTDKSQENRILNLSMSLWTFDPNTYSKTAQPYYRDLIKKLSNLLNQKFESHDILFLSDYRNRLLSIGFDIPESPSKWSDRIKSTIEQILIENAGLEAVKLNWKENILSIPSQKKEKILFPKFDSETSS